MNTWQFITPENSLVNGERPTPEDFAGIQLDRSGHAYRDSEGWHLRCLRRGTCRGVNLAPDPVSLALGPGELVVPVFAGLGETKGGADWIWLLSDEVQTPAPAPSLHDSYPS